MKQYNLSQTIMQSIPEDVRWELLVSIMEKEAVDVSSEQVMEVRVIIKDENRYAEKYPKVLVFLKSI